MGTITAHALDVSQASSATSILVPIGACSQYQGRAILTCERCGRAQFNRGQDRCVACYTSLLVHLEPLADFDAAERVMEIPGEASRRACTRLRDLRMELDMTQWQLADAAGCPRTYITKYENGWIAPSITLLERIVAGLGISMTELLDDSLSVEFLALRSAARSPGERNLFRSLLKCLPKLNQQRRSLLLNSAASLASQAIR